MRYVIIPTDDLAALFTEEEMANMRKSNDGKSVIAHEEVLLRKREALGLMTLPINQETGRLEWPYPTYEHGSGELEGLLASEEWKGEEDG